jgi:squalene-associated FAD-dependent desaturase
VKKKIVVIGAGVAGISAAISLAEGGNEVVLIEGSMRLGGRACSFIDNTSGEVIDNGQHVMMGAYHNFLQIVDQLGTSSNLHWQNGLKVVYHEKGGKRFTLNAGMLPGKLGMILGLITFKPLDIKSKICIISFFIKAYKNRLDTSIKTISQLLTEENQTDNSITIFWTPLVLAVMNASLNNSSAGLFVEALNRAFFSGNRDNSIIISKEGLSELFNPLPDWLEKHGCSLLKGVSVHNLIIENGNFVGVRLSNDSVIYADIVISCIPSKPLKKIIPEELSNHPFFLHLDDFSYSTIISAYIWLDRPVMDDDFTALLGTKTHWLFNKRNFNADTNSKFPYLVAATISGANDNENLSNNEILEIIFKDINDCMPNASSSKVIHSVLFRDRKATILATPGSESLRLPNSTPVTNFFIAGDWTDTGLPATIEGAAFSGKNAAKLANDYIKN